MDRIMETGGMNPSVVIVDYGLGNLFSVERAMRYIGANVKISDKPEEIQEAERLVLPGVGAFGDGIKGLQEKGLIEPIKEFVKSGKPLLGICLGMQLLTTEGEEFGIHKGLDIVEGRVMRLKPPKPDGSSYKIPHVGWNRLLFPQNRENYGQVSDHLEQSFWQGTILENHHEGVFVYFVHSYVVVPEDPSDILAETVYGNNIFCSVLHKENIFACQFHPERSGEVGLEIYRQFVFGIQPSYSRI